MSGRRRFGGKWAEVTLGRIAGTYGGLAGKTKSDFGTGSARYISFLDVLENVILTPRGFDRVRIARHESQNRVRVGDVLFNATSETPEDLAMGSMAAVDASDLYLNSFCFGLRILDRGRCDPLFLAYLFRGKPGRTAMYGLAQGATRYNLSKQRFLALQLRLPPLPEQRAIAAVLMDVDALIGSLEVLIAKKRAIKQAAMQQLLPGRARLPGFRGEWETKLIGELADVDPENLSASTPPDFSFNYISIDDVDAGRLAGYTKESFKTAPSRARRVVRAGDVLMSTVRPALRGHLLFDGRLRNPVCSTGFAVLRAKRGLCEPHFLFAHLFGDVVDAQLQALLVGSNYPAINGTDVRGLRVTCPPTLGEQRAIANILADMDAEIAALERRLDKTCAVKQGMMQQLLTGSIRLPIPDAIAENGPGQ